MQHAVADEAVAHARDHADLLDRLRQLHGAGEHILAGFFSAHHLQQLHDVGGAEEMQPQHVLRTRGDRGDFVHVQRRGIRREDRARLADLVEFLEHLLLDRHVFENRFDDDVDVPDVVVAGHAGEQAHALVHRFLGQAPLGDRRRVVLAYDTEPFVERRLVHFQHFHRDAGVGEVHGNAPAHGAGADQRGGFDFAHRRVLRYVGDLADLALGEEQMS